MKDDKPRTRRQQRSNSTRTRYDRVHFEYYVRPFLLMHEEYRRYRAIGIVESCHPIRRRFWQHVPQGTYDRDQSIELLQAYLKSLNSEARQTFSRHSIAYWLHVYRRLSPGPIGADERPQSIGLTRAVFEAALQKHATHEFCSGIGESKRMPIGQVLAGALLAEQFETERKALLDAPDQLVLAEFTTVSLADVYQAEMLAYEVWRTGAMLRIVGQGAKIVATGPPDYMADTRSEELAYLVANYDDRIHHMPATSAGVTYAEEDDGHETAFFPTYNLGGVTAKVINPLLRRLYDVEMNEDLVLNFMWIPFNLRSYRMMHMPLAEAFEKRHGVPLDVVLTTIGALSAWAMERWLMGGIADFLRLWQRAYTGPHDSGNILDSIQQYWTKGLALVGAPQVVPDPVTIQAGISFWTLGTDQVDRIDTVYSGPHQLLLPVGKGRFFVDYAWILRRLYDLFVGVSISDGNFKGNALEVAIGRGRSALPTRPCIASDGARRQVDFATAVGEHLVIAECKAVARSIAFDRGRPEAIRYRQNHVVDRGLQQADDNAKWLAARPRGRNYDVTIYKDILPVAVSPFVEFMPSLNYRYWINGTLPRVLTPDELTSLLSRPDLVATAMNRVRITSPSNAS